MPASGLYQGPVWESACCLRPELLPANVMLKRQELLLLHCRLCAWPRFSVLCRQVWNYPAMIVALVSGAEH